MCTVVHRHRFDADPDTTLHFYVAPDSDTNPASSFMYIVRNGKLFII
jgi:hypothetical protein